MRFSLKIRQAAEQIPCPSCRSLGNTSLAWILVRAKEVKEVLWPSDHSRMGLQHWERELGVGWISGAASIGEGFQPSWKDTDQMQDTSQTPGIFLEWNQHKLAWAAMLLPILALPIFLSFIQQLNTFASGMSLLQHLLGCLCLLSFFEKNKPKQSSLSPISRQFAVLIQQFFWV